MVQLKGLCQFLREYRGYFVVGHEDPDGDSVGSQLALAELLRHLGAEVCLLSAGPFRRGEIREFAPQFARTIPSEIVAAVGGGGWGVVVLDCSTSERMGSELLNALKELPAGVIDHHPSGERYGTVRWVDPGMPSVAAMVYLLFLEMGVPVTPLVAEYLFLGVATDTGYFRHLGCGSSDTFRTCAALVDMGANPGKIFRRINGNKSLDSKRLLGTLLQNTEEHCGGKILIACETREMVEKFDIGHRDSDALYQQLQEVEGVEILLLIREEQDGSVSVGLRTDRAIDVGTLASRFGGGGHSKASGFKSSLPKTELIELLIGECRKLIE